MLVKGIALSPIRLSDKWYEVGEKISEEITKEHYEQIKDCIAQAVETEIKSERQTAKSREDKI